MLTGSASSTAPSAAPLPGRIAPRVEFPAPDRVQWGAMSYQGSPAATSTGIIIIV